jgi:hypothetical protein
MELINAVFRNTIKEYIDPSAV